MGCRGADSPSQVSTRVPVKQQSVDTGPSHDHHRVPSFYLRVSYPDSTASRPRHDRNPRCFVMTVMALDPFLSYLWCFNTTQITAACPMGLALSSLGLIWRSKSRD